MPAQGVPGASPYLTTPKVPCVPQLLCCMSARAISAGAAPVEVLLKKALSPQKQLQSEAESLGFRGFFGVTCFSRVAAL